MVKIINAAHEPEYMDGWVRELIDRINNGNSFSDVEQCIREQFRRFETSKG